MKTTTTVNEWVSRIERAQKRAKKEWLDDGRRALRIYHNGRPSRAAINNREPFNILYSNTETLSPALFNSAPRPDIGARRAKAEPLTKAAAQALHQYLDFLLDCNDARYESFTDVVSQAVVSALVPGLGQLRVREPEVPGAHLSVESVPFDRFLWGWARRWQHVPWVAFGHDLTYLDFKSRYPKFAKEINEDQAEAGEYGFNNSGEEGEHDEKTTRVPGVLVWEIWDKGSRTIYEVCDQIPGQQLAARPWPLKFSASFPCPRPLTFVEKVGTLAPTPLYCFYENQAEELNRITRRLNRILEAIKVRGVYNSMLGEIARVLEEEEDSALVPAQSAQLLAENGGLDRHIWLMPIEDLMKVAKELFAARQEVKGTIYEIMGIADILRGQSVASETATAQGIKDRWGTLRLKKSQRQVQFFIRDTFRLLAEAAPQVVPVPAWQAATDVNLPTEQEKAQKLAELATMELMGQPAPPEQRQQLESQPTWEQVLGFLNDEAQRSFRIDVETNSTVDIEATEDKAAIAEFMNAMGQFLAGIAPMVEQGIMPFEAAKGMMLEIMRRFRFSKQVEEYLMQMSAPQQQKGDPEAEKARKDAETEIEKLKDFESKLKDAVRELEEKKKDLDFARKEFQLEQRHAGQLQQMQGQMQELKLNGKVQMATQKLTSTADKISMGFAQKAQEVDSKAREVAGAESRVKETSQGAQKALDPIIQMLQTLQQNQAQMSQALAQVTQAVSEISEDGGEREIAMMGADGKVRTALVRKAKKAANAKGPGIQ